MICEGIVYSYGRGEKRRWNAEIKAIGGVRGGRKRGCVRQFYASYDHPTMGAAVRSANRALRGLGWLMPNGWAKAVIRK